MSYTVKIVTGCRIVKKVKVKKLEKLVSMFEKRIMCSPLLLHPLQGSSCPGVDLLPLPLHWAHELTHEMLNMGPLSTPASRGGLVVGGTSIVVVDYCPLLLKALPSPCC